jgi:hypothetical protein
MLRKMQSKSVLHTCSGYLLNSQKVIVSGERTVIDRCQLLSLPSPTDFR